MPTRRTRLGDFGEHAAAALLQRQGYAIVARKWRCRSGEIDLVVRSSQELVFVEVRTRRGSLFPEESIDLRKQQKLADLAYSYIEQTALADDLLWRIDVIAISIDEHGKITRIEHIRNAVEL